MKDILSMLPEELAEEFKKKGFPAFRAKQVTEWLKKGVSFFDEMNNLSKEMREILKQEYHLYRPVILRKQVSKLDGTVKYLWGLEDGNAVETVVMKYHYGNTVCVSTQVGCRQACAFCASAIGGLVRNMEPSEILNEVVCSEKDSGEKITHIVLMGTGEPLDNFDNVMRFLQLVNHPQLKNIGMRHISLSTCGILERFDDLAEKNYQLTLAVSLHAPDDETRNRIMPANRGRGVDAVVNKCVEYFEKTGRRVSFEYAMIDGVNDTEAHAKLLAKRANAAGAHVNLIPLNNVEEYKYKPSTQGHMKAFIKVLEDAGVNVTVRRRLGSDVDASCGQLRRKYQKSVSEEK